MNIFVSYPSPKEEDKPTAFTSASDLAEHLIALAGDADETLCDVNDNEINCDVKLVTELLESGKTIIVGDFIESGTRIELNENMRDVHPITRFLRADSMQIDDVFCRNVELEPKLEPIMLDYLLADDGGKQALLEQWGEEPVFMMVLNDGDTTYEFTFEDIVKARSEDEKLIVTYHYQGNEYHADVWFYKLALC